MSSCIKNSFPLHSFLKNLHLCWFQSAARRSVHRQAAWPWASSRPLRRVAYISLGSNFGGSKRLRTIESALTTVREEVGPLDACSCLYESLPGYDIDPRSKEEHNLSIPLHLNAVIRVKTDIADPHRILDILLDIEARHGRDRSSTDERLHRTLDLDLLLFKNENAESILVNAEQLTLPHPRLAQRNFVLFPLCDIDPDLMHPTEGQTVKELVLRNLKRREEALQQSLANHSSCGNDNINGSAAPYTLDGNLAVPRRCFAPNDKELWTVKGSKAAITDTLRWIGEVMQRYRFNSAGKQEQAEPEFVESLCHLKRLLENEPQTPRLMGVLNITPESFSDGGKYYGNVEAALGHARNLVADGAHIIDVGGEATNPNVQEEIPVEKETERVLPVIEAIRKHVGAGAVISVDTRRKPVAHAAAAFGADMVNDVSGGVSDPNLLSFVASRGLPFVIMHSRGTPKSMDSLANYENTVDEVARFLTEKAILVMQMGLPRWRLILDAGLGFAKTPEHSFEILRSLRELQAKIPNGIPILIGHSRKRFIGAAIKNFHCPTTVKLGEARNSDRDKQMGDRDIAGLAVACWSAMCNCVDILRVHDVKKTALVCSVMEMLVAQHASDPAVDFCALFPGCPCPEIGTPVWRPIAHYRQLSAVLCSGLRQGDGRATPSACQVSLISLSVLPSTPSEREPRIGMQSYL
ncbi:folic acid synthesis protein fol1 [Cyclospora cayetanensis]|uniref:Folic acid synthesis protein fol1 n=1 Tax=Cyclospora cayetanensis TaxID=88456 RepID=A0A6P6RXJ5_9EIME|nr:folic acid synthesis protein fol1 [Cyclospora cayetanensis]